MRQIGAAEQFRDFGRLANENEVAACVEAGRRALRETAGHPGGVHTEVVGHRKAAVAETLAQDVAQPDR